MLIMDIIIQNGILVTGSDIFKAEILLSQGKIASISEKIVNPEAFTIDASGLYVFPGFIDPHTHLELDMTPTASTADDFYTGTVAAAIGGTTTVIDYVVPEKEQTFENAFNCWKTKAQKAVIDYGFHMTFSNPLKRPMEELKYLKKVGITSLKCFTTYADNLMISDDKLYQVMSIAKEEQILLSMHCENGSLLKERINNLLKAKKLSPYYHAESRPEILEVESASRVIDIARIIDLPVFIAHLSSYQALERIHLLKKYNQAKVFIESCPQYLMLDNTYLTREDGAKYVFSPPLRDKKNNQLLWKALLNGDIDVIGTDHCPFNYAKEKQEGITNFTQIPNGLPGVEDRVNIMFSEGVIKRKLDINSFISLLTLKPAKLFGLYPQKGTLNIGSDADIVIYDPHHEHIISAKSQAQNVDYNPYEGLKLTGKPKIVISKGKIISQDGKFIGEKGFGQYLPRETSVAFH